MQRTYPKYLKTYLTYFLLSIAYFSFAQSHLTNVTKFSVEEGLSGRYVNDIVEDQNGFLWISTWLGLDRFDGYGVKNYQGNDFGISQEKYRKMHIDPMSRLWLLNIDLDSIQSDQVKINSIDIFNTATEKIENDFLQKLPFKISDIIVTTSDLNQNIWFGLNTGEVFKFNGQQFELIVKTSSLRRMAISGENILAVQNEINSEKQFNFYNFKGEILDSTTLQVEGEIRRIVPDHNEEILVALVEKNQPYATVKWVSISPFSPIQNIQFFEGTQPVVFRLENYQLATFKFSPDGRFWIFKKGTIKVFDKNNQLIYNFEEELKPFTIGANKFFFDKRGNNWLCSADGFGAISLVTNPFKNFLVPEKLADTRSICEDSKGNIYINQNWTYQYQPTSGKLKKLDGLRGSRGIYYAKNQKLYLGQYGPEIIEYDPITQEKYSYSLNEISNQKLTSQQRVGNVFLQSKKTGNIHVGTQSSGLILLDAEKKKLFRKEKWNTFHDQTVANINFLKETNQGIFIGTNEGIYLLDEEKGIQEHYPILTKDKKQTTVLSILPNESGSFWIGTLLQGLLLWSPKEGIIKHLTTDNGLSDNTIYAVYEHEFGYLWLTSNQGLMQMNKSTFEIKTYLPSDGIPHKEFNATSHFQASDGTFYFGGLKGVTSFHPKVFEKNLTQPKTIISQIQISDTQTGESKDITLDFKKNGTIKLEENHSNLKIHLVAMDKISHDRNQYAYRLASNMDWILMENNIVELLHVDYGKINLEIKSRIRNENWSQEPLKIKIHRSKIFYLQSPFVALVSLGLAVIAFLFYKKAKKQKKETEQKIKEAIELVKKSLAPPTLDDTNIPNSTAEIEEKSPASADDEWMENLNKNAQLLIENGKFSIVELAATMNLSERQFRRKLKQISGLLPVDFMREIRLQKAKQLLLSGAFPTVALVCYEVGFATPKHFSKLFQERFGKNPSFFLTKNSDEQNP